MAKVSEKAPTTLVERLQKQYAERWPVLLDALFAPPNAGGSAALHNRFAGTKARGEPLLVAGEVTLARAPEPAAASRHTASGLLTHFLASPASILPALALTPPPGGSLLLLGNPPAGRLLALAQLLFGHTAPSEPSSPSRRSRTASRSRSASLEQAGIPANGNAQPAEGEPDSSAAVQRALPGFIYGEQRDGSSGAAEGDQRPSAGLPGLPLGAAVPADSLQLYWGGLGALLEGLLFRGVRAGCCTVRTKSGDWAELAEAAVAEQPGGTPHDEGSGAAELAGLEPEAGGGLLDCRQLPQQAAAQLGQLLQHHLPQGVRRRIRLVGREEAEAPTDEKPCGSYGSESYDVVVVEAQAAAPASAVVAACQAGTAAQWPSAGEAALIGAQAQLLLAGFKALRPGGLLLFCSTSLAWEETEGLVAACCSQLGPAAVVLPGLPGGGEELAVALKRFGAERGEHGWRLLPDLSLEGPAYFSLLRKQPEAEEP